VIRLRRGLLLEPREDLDGIAAIEIEDGRVSIDGDRTSVDELEPRLGAAGAAVALLVEARDERGRAREVEEAEPAVAAPEDEPRSRRPRRQPRTGPRSDSQVVIGSGVTVEADEETRDLTVFGGRVVVRGQVIGDIWAVGGSVLIATGGEVTGDLAAVGGPVTLEAGSEVRGDVVTLGNEVSVHDEAIIGGQLKQSPFGPAVSFTFSDDEAEWDWDSDWWGRGSGLPAVFGIFSRFFGVLMLVLLACLAYLLARAPVERMEAKLRVEPWKAGLVGLVAALLFLPVLFTVFVILLVSIIGWPLLLLLPFALVGVVVVAFLGGTAVALRIGRWTEETFGWKMVNAYVAIVVGVALISVWSFVADLLDLLPGPFWPFVMMFWLVGCIVEFVVLLLGLGAALLTRFGTQDEYPGNDLAPLPPIPSPGGDRPAASGELEPLPDLDWDSSDESSGEETWEPEVETATDAEPPAQAPVQPGADSAIEPEPAPEPGSEPEPGDKRSDSD
jgi:hypothetical protein